MSTKFRSDDTVKWKYGFGRGRDGASYSTPAYAGCSGTSGSTTLTLDSADSFANDDLVLIHQSRGTGVGGYMLNKIVSGGGTTTLTLEIPLDITYTDSGASQAQIIELKEYKNLTLSGTTTVTAWDGNKYGIIAFLNKGTLTGSSGILDLNGGNGSKVQSDNTGGGVGGGFRGAGIIATSSNPANGRQGEGTSGAGGAQSLSNTGNGGSGGQYGGGPGGGNGAAGSKGSQWNGDTDTGSSPGSTAGNAELTSIVFGGGAGGGYRYSAGGTVYGGGGGNGGGIAFIFSENIDLSSLTVRTNGGNGANSSTTDWNNNPGMAGGGGAGGSVLYKCVNATLGSNKTTATAGSRGLDETVQRHGGNGGVGRIAVDHSGTITGTTNPTFNDRTDATIKAGGATGNFLAFL